MKKGEYLNLNPKGGKGYRRKNLKEKGGCTEYRTEYSEAKGNVFEHISPKIGEKGKGKWWKWK